MTILEKLQAKGQASALVLNPPEEAAGALGEIAAAMRLSRKAGKGPYGLILVYVRDAAQLAASLERARTLMIDAELLWFAYPKKTSTRYASDLGRDSGWETLGTLGYRPVRQIALDGDWTALRFTHRSKG